MTSIAPTPPGPSYVHGHSGQPLIGITIGDFLDQAAADYGDRDALIACGQGTRLSYAGLKQLVDDFAAGLLELGILPGDRVGIWAPNCAEWTIVQFATAKAGIILVNINPAYRISELTHALTLVGCKALVTATRFKTSDYIAMLGQLIPDLSDQTGEIASEQLPDLRHIITLGLGSVSGCRRYADVLDMGAAAGPARLDAAAATVQFDDPVNIQFTSGTTGLPKGATLSHHNLLNNAFCVAEATGIAVGDRVCIPVPLYHCFGMVMGNLGCLTHGATMIYPSEAFDPGEVLRMIETERCTILYGVPTMFVALLSHPDIASFDLGSLRGGIMAGASCPTEVMKKVMNDMHMGEITIAYGMTETSPVSFQTRRDDPIDLRVSTVGTIMPHLEVKIVDEEGRIVPHGTTGELCTRGYSVMLGYWGDEERTREAIDTGGWMHTGDVAAIDEAGYCRIVGRLKDMVIRGGENVYPCEVEQFLHRHPDIRDVQVVGVPDRKYGEELCAWIIPRDPSAIDADGIREFCKGQIAHYKVPRYIKFVDGYPMTVTGKVQKFAIREQMIAELALSTGEQA